MHHFAPLCMIPGCDTEQKLKRPDLLKGPAAVNFVPVCV
jgi:hypothetical protein